MPARPRVDDSSSGLASGADRSSCISKSFHVYSLPLDTVPLASEMAAINIGSQQAYLVLAILLPGAFPAPAYSQSHQSSSTGTIEGTITVTGKDQLYEEIVRVRSLNRYEEHVHLTAEPRPYRLSEKAAVYIESVNNGQKFNPPSTNPRLDQEELMFRPLVLPVLVGTSVDFPNSDEVFHNVFSYSKPKEFDLGRYPKGQRKRVLFDEVGVVNIYCDIHAYMYATVLVLDNPYFAVPDDDGQYEIPNVRPGTYKLGFWYGRKEVDSRTITIRAGESTLVHFAY